MIIVDDDVAEAGPGPVARMLPFGAGRGWSGLPAWARSCLVAWSVPGTVGILLLGIQVFGPGDKGGQGLWLVASFLLMMALGAALTLLLGIRDALQAGSILPFLRNVLCASGIVLGFVGMAIAVMVADEHWRFKERLGLRYECEREVPPMEVRPSGDASSR